MVMLAAYVVLRCRIGRVQVTRYRQTFNQM